MKSSIPNLFLCIFFFMTKLLHAQQSQDNCRTTQIILEDLKKYHYSPPVFDETVQKEVIALFMTSLDQKGFYFLSDDKKELEKTVTTAGENIFCSTLEKSLVIFRKRLEQTDSMITQILNKPIDFNLHDTIVFKVKRETSFQDNSQALRKFIEKRLTFAVLARMEKNEEDSAAKDKPAKPEEESRIRVMKEYIRQNLHLLGDQNAFQRYVMEKLWNAMMHRCDPHSDYFNTDEKQNFEKILSSEELSYGIVVNENDEGEIEIVRVVPGSPAWKANELNVGDILTEISTADGKKYDCASMSEDEITQLIESSSASQMKFTVRKKNNQEKNVKLVKEKIQSEQNSISGYILKDSVARIGYIPLPAFYGNFESENFLGCSNDVAKEILKLKKENIHGLILDLRNNGGGSMQEAMSMAGIFIDEGPLGILKSRDQKPYLLRDMNRGTVYDGPLLVMVNGLSASASEFLSAVLQDYNRAIIVGETTYGKGTAQAIILVDSLEKYSHVKKKGYLKLTDSKFYRVSCCTNQSRGVAPDIELPGICRMLNDFKEAAEPYHLLPDTVVKKVVYQAYPAFPLDYLRQKSLTRTSGNPEFGKINSLADSVSQLYGKELRVALNKKSVHSYYHKIDIFEKQLKSLSEYENKSFRVLNNQYMNSLLALDANQEEENSHVLKNIQSDAQLEEAFLILDNYIHYLNISTK